MANGHPFFSSFQLTKEALFDNDLTTGQNWPKQSAKNVSVILDQCYKDGSKNRGSRENHV